MILQYRADCGWWRSNQHAPWQALLNAWTTVSRMVTRHHGYRCEPLNGAQSSSSQIMAVLNSFSMRFIF